MGADRVQLTLGPRHSYETQLIRSGVDLPVKSVSVGGLILSNDGYLVIGLRGGYAFPNTYHHNAGSLQVTEGLKRGEQSIYDIFKIRELDPEFGIDEADIIEATLHSRIMDYSIDRGPAYNFLLKTSMSAEELELTWRFNPHPDKGEHMDIQFVLAEDVDKFINENYVGICENRLDRSDDERYLLHPGALSLASLSRMPVTELRKLHIEGMH